MPEEVFQYNISSGLEWNNWFKPLMGGPLDARTIVKSRASLDEAEFKSYNPFIGMIVVVVEDLDESKNGLWWAYGRDSNGLLWRQIEMGSSSGIDWPPAPSPYDPNKKYFLRFTGDGTEPVWEEVTIEEGQTFTFTATSPYIENDTGYSIGSNLQSSEEMTLNNQYTYDNEHKTADVISVKDSDTAFHLMLNPDINYVLYGGDSEGMLQVQLTVESPIEKGRWEIHEIAPIGLAWFISSGLYNTNPNDAIVHWYPSLQDAINRQNEVTNINDSAYNYLDENGETFTFGAVATKDGYRDSMEREITISIIDDSINIDVFINDVTRTTAEIEN